MLEPCVSLPVAAEKTTRFTEAVGDDAAPTKPILLGKPGAEIQEK